MKDSVVYILHKLLQKNKVAIDEKEVKYQLLSHPTYPSLHALTGVLDHFNVKSFALKATVDQETLDQLETNFIAQITNDTGEHFVLFVRNKDQIKLVFSKEYTQVLSEGEFLKIWTGVLLFIEAPEENNVSESVKNTRLKKVVSVVTLSFFTLFFLMLKPPFSVILHFVLAGFGTAFSWLIVSKDLGVESNTLNRFCSAGRDKVNCDAVLNSKGSTVFNFFKLSDIGMVYFASSIIASILLSLGGRNTIFIYLISVFAFPFTIYSIYYQFFVVKNWCALCLCIVAILWLQLLIVGINFSTIWIASIGVMEWMIPVLSFLLVTTLWSYLLPLLKKEIELRKEKIEHLRFRRNYSIFEALLSKSETLPQGLVANEEIVLGSEDKAAKLTLIVITNPACGHCKEVHTLVDKIVKRYANDLKVIVRFNIPVALGGTDALNTAARLIDININKGQEQCLVAMTDAYSDLGLDKWLKKWGTSTNENYTEVVLKQNSWCVDHNKNFTPEIIIEGKSFPKEYKREDLFFFIEELVAEK